MMEYLTEVEDKIFHDHQFESRLMMTKKSANRVWVSGPIIVGAGPSGLAVAACLKQRGIQSLILERANCIGSLWQLKTYDCLRLHLPKEFCQLPLMPFPSDFPTYPTKVHFVSYLEEYARHFQLNTVFNNTVVCAEFDHGCALWRVKSLGLKNEEAEYLGQWLVVSTGENADEVFPNIEGLDEFVGPVLHTSSYRKGDVFREKRVLVVGCGNSGMEVCFDLCNNNAYPSLVVRDSVHVLPREMLGRSTFVLSMWLLKWFPLRLVDGFLLFMSRLLLGDTAKLGLSRPKIGPLQLKTISGKTPILDVGTIPGIRTGKIKVCPGIKRITSHSAEFVDGRVENFDVIILATGYKSNVPTWLKENNFFSEKDGFPKKAFPNGWKGEHGLYAVGFSRRGLHGSSLDAQMIAKDIEHDQVKSGPNQLNPSSMHHHCRSSLIT